MNRTLRATCAVITIAFLSQPIMAWDGFGHMAVASVAYRNLDSATRKRVDALIKLNPYFSDATKWPKLIPAGTSAADKPRYFFMLAATWPDKIKSDSKYHNDGSQNGDVPDGPEANRNTGYDDLNRHKYWHFVDTPFSQDGTDVSAMKIPTPDAQTRIDDFRVVLASNAKKKLKSYDLVWLLHIVGDVHQPLHATTRVSATFPQGDIGGNSVGFCTLTAPTCGSELHAFWDNVLGTSDLVKSADQFAATLTVPSVGAADIDKSQKWLDESFNLAKTVVYVNPPIDNGAPPFRATPEYTSTAQDLAKQQVALAGARLALVIKTDLK
jgi:hypothetical protein